MAVSPAIIPVPVNSSLFRVGSLAREVPPRFLMKYIIQYLRRATDFLHLAPPYLAEIVHLTGRRHLRSAASGKLDVQRTATAIGRRNFAVSGPETWNSLQAELRLSTLSTSTIARLLKAHLFVSTE